MSNDLIRPSSIEGIKQLARRIKKANDLPHAIALDKAAQAGGFSNYQHARRACGIAGPTAMPASKLYISVPWKDRSSNQTGREILKIAAGQNLKVMLNASRLRSARTLSTMRFDGPDHLTATNIASSQSRAREQACSAAREIQFIETTGLVPSAAKRSIPRGDYQNRMPGSDHDATWFDSATKAYVRTTEPYTNNSEISPEQLAWAEKHGWSVASSPWNGMYYPDGGSMLFLMADASKGYLLDPIIAKLANAPAPLLASEWNGKSEPFLPVFCSPGRLAEITAKIEARKGPPKKRPANNSVPYSGFLSGMRRRPKGTMPVEAHKAVGRLLKSVLVGTVQRAGVHRRVEAIRCELDNWVQCEHNREQMPDKVFNELYYHALSQNDPFSLPPPDKTRHIVSLTEVKALLSRHYPECAPLRELLKKADFAISSLQSW